MLRALGSRIVRTLVPIGLSAALAVAGCEASRPTPMESEIELRASSGGPSGWILSEGDEIAESIAADPAFAQLVDVGARIMGELHAAQLEMSDEEVDSIARTINEPWFPEVMGPNALLEHLGGNPQDLRQLRNLVDQLRDKHGLHSASPDDLGYVFELAIDSGTAQQLMKAAVESEVQTALQWTACEAPCYAVYMSGFVIALGFFLVAMVVAAATFPFGIILAMLAIAAFEFAMAQLLAALALCLAKCEGYDYDYDYDFTLCGDDVCTPDEYCWTGVLGIGDDECRPEKTQGKVCANHEQCASDCCKYHLLTNPVSKVCRPASACN